MFSTEYNPPEALRILKEAGWEDRDGDGRLDKDGRPFKVALIVDNRDKAKEWTGLIIRQQFQEIGVEMELIRLETPVFLERVLRTGQFDLAVVQFNAGNDPALSALLYSSKYLGRSNMAWYTSEQVDSLFRVGETLTDIELRKPVYRALHRRLAADHPVTFLFFKRLFGAINRRLGGIEAQERFLNFYSVRKWYRIPPQ